MIKGTSHILDKKRIHFFDGVFRSGSDLNQYDALLRDHQPDIHVIALSPNGEVIGYEPVAMLMMLVLNIITVVYFTYLKIQKLY
jgi:hypothetical protein